MILFRALTKKTVSIVHIELLKGRHAPYSYVDLSCDKTGGYDDSLERMRIFKINAKRGSGWQNLVVGNELLIAYGMDSKPDGGSGWYVISTDTTLYPDSDLRKKGLL